MFSRDFVYAFILGQVRAGLSEDDAKNNFSDWIKEQDESIILPNEKETVISDLSSYNVKPNLTKENL